MRCPGCHQENVAPAKFCAACGSRLPRPCPACGTHSPPGSLFCIECGADLRDIATSVVDSKAAPPAAAPLGQPPQPIPAPVAARPAFGTAPPIRYTPPHLAEQILRGRARLEGERKQVTVLFADAQDFSQIARRLDPEEVHGVMDGAFRILIDQIHQFEGTINQFLGDGVMALFGAPVVHEDGPRRAVSAALGIQKALAGYSAETERRYGLPFQMRIGINSGMVVVGTIGNDLRMDYTAVGDVTILAERLQSEAEPGTVTISENTYRRVRGFFRCEPVRVRIKHAPEPIQAYRVIEPVDAAEVVAVSWATPFVGRTRELETLEQVYRRASAGRGQVLGVVGEAGIGKTRLLVEFLSRQPAGSRLVLRGRCHTYGATVPFLPVVSLLRRHFAITDRDTESEVRTKVEAGLLAADRSLSEALPYFLLLMGRDPGNGPLRAMDPKQVRARMVDALRALLQALARQGLVVLLIEGLHWVDQPTVDFLNALVEGMAAMRLLLLATYRPGFGHGWAEHSYYTQIALDRLDPEESAQVVAGVLGVAQVSPEVREPILRRTEGVPFYLEEVTHAFLDRGAIVREAGQITLRSPEAELGVPETIQEVIQARLDRLEDHHKKIIQIASVIGREFALMLLQEVTKLGDEARRQMEALRHLELVYEKNLFPSLEYMFKHSLTHDVAYNTILVQRRKELHALVGRVIEEVYRGRLEEHFEILAHHFKQTDEVEKAVPYLQLAGDKAVRLHATPEARKHYTEGLKLLDRLPPGPETARLRIDLCVQIANASFYSEAIGRNLELLEGAAAAAAELNDTHRLARVYHWIGRLHYVRGDQDSAIGYFQKFLTLAEEVGDQELIALHYNVMGRAYQLRGDLQPAMECLEEGVRRLEGLGNLSEVALSLGILGICHASRGDLTQGIAVCQRALEMAERIKHPVRVGGACAHLGLILAEFGRPDEAEPYLQRATEIFEGTGEKFYRYLTRAGRGLAALRRGEPAAARRLFTDGIAFAREIGTHIILNRVIAWRAESSLALGDVQEADRTLTEAGEAARVAKDRIGGGIVRLARARALMAEPVPALDRVEAELRTAAALLEEMGAKAFLARAATGLAHLLAQRGAGEEAARWREQARAIFSQGGYAWDLEILEKGAVTPTA